MREKVELACGERLQQTGHEQNEIGARHKVARDRFLHSLDGVRSRRIDYVEIAQNFERIVIEMHVLRRSILGAGFAVSQNGNGARGWQVAHRKDFVAEQSIDERALAAVVFADDNEQEQLVHLVDERCKPLEIRA